MQRMTAFSAMRGSNTLFPNEIGEDEDLFFCTCYLTAFFPRTTWVSRHQKGKPLWILMKQEMMGGSGISWTICKSFAPRCHQITMPVSHHSAFIG